MTDVFVSYKREDEVRVAKLVAALEASGLSVWWDRVLPGAEPWREGIARALDEARCTVVVWTQASTGPAGGFVRDEAGRAARAGRLVPVCLDRVAPPLGFGELQAIDLTRWRGRRSDPFFQDLLAAVHAKLTGRPTPAPRGPLARLRRRITLGTLGTVGAALLGAFASNALKLQDRLCAATALQPAVATCAAGWPWAPRQRVPSGWPGKPGRRAVAPTCESTWPTSRKVRCATRRGPCWMRGPSPSRRLGALPARRCLCA